ncbi:predicted protein [Botrytis cinerea T4]|uniref:Uncharacterized protein n=1 Tax=Botryotinia fuckeliana (strain T4) TaxID=999810 RepID=G2YT17_BOTF4|nr:predicted protein [Botrytis cinerea T4]
MFLRRGQFIDGIHPKHGPYPPFIYDVLCMQIFDASWKQKVPILHVLVNQWYALATGLPHLASRLLKINRT